MVLNWSTFKCMRVIVVRAYASQSVDLGSISQVKPYQKTLKNGIHSFVAWRSAQKRIVRRTMQQASLLCPCARHLTERLHLHVADKWRTRTSPGYNCEAANPACRKRRLLKVYPPMAVRLVGGGATSHS